MTGFNDWSAKMTGFNKNVFEKNGDIYRKSSTEKRRCIGVKKKKTYGQ